MTKIDRDIIAKVKDKKADYEYSQGQKDKHRMKYEALAIAYYIMDQLNEMNNSAMDCMFYLISII
jgi:hypothetical protein